MNDDRTGIRTCADVTPDPDAACEECGAFGAVAAGDRKLCPECYGLMGACCSEFGKDDLWNEMRRKPEASG